MIRCAVLDDYQQVAKSIADWASIEDRVEVTVFHEHMADEDELAAALAPFEIIVIMRERTPFRAPLLARLPNLKLIVTTGMRNASVDLEAAAARGVVVSGTSGLSSHTAELTWALILGLARNIVQEHGAVRQGMWQSTLGTDLCGKKLGVLGLGKLGGRVAKIGLAFGMEVAAWSQNLTQERADEAGVRLAGSKEELLAESDFVSIHLVLSDRTRGLIGAEQLKLMRPDAYLINTSRAPIVDQAALAQALREGWIAGAGLDVYETEPLPKDHPFRTLPNVLTTPHLGYVTKDNYRVFYQDAVDDIRAFLEGAPIRRLA
ncbi:Glycerate dehydrogenase [Paenibacillus konkukensis]|uniref:Glycerate dehydrogenase n=1 Tax=Paenibacillus konkukensis TaxID=2020716 RepID=A0ABY4RID2_9BACL|nr:D-2-hydroxyacid dehydrogenase family protein [Paenibacillus konkukensis]UQZ81364.1 Glycerate dehydrogenase [Paenibacillus konkukensis]